MKKFRLFVATLFALAVIALQASVSYGSDTGKTEKPKLVKEQTSTENGQVVTTYKVESEVEISPGDILEIIAEESDTAISTINVIWDNKPASNAKAIEWIYWILGSIVAIFGLIFYWRDKYIRKKINGSAGGKPY